MSNRPQVLPLIFSDLDGTLLDHDDYSFAAAQAAINYIKRNHIPLLINSSKTASEIFPVQQALGIRQPFICENGAAVYLPSDTDESWLYQAFSKPRSHCLKILWQLRDDFGYRFTGFNDCSTKEIAELTGLSLTKAELAAQRTFTEPILWQDSADRLCQFQQQLVQQQLNFQQGGRFLCIMADSCIDKAQAMAWLTKRYAEHTKVVTIALGDSPNDQAMLNAADIAVVVQSANSEDIQLDKPGKILRTQSPGPNGWQWAIDQLLPFEVSVGGEADG